MPEETHSPSHPMRVAVVGVGNVGASFAYAVALSGLTSELVLNDLDRRRAEGEAVDLAHAVSAPAEVAELRQSAVVLRSVIADLPTGTDGPPSG